MFDFIYVVVNFIFPLFLGMVMYANELKTKVNQKLTATYSLTCNSPKYHLFLLKSP